MDCTHPWDIHGLPEAFEVVCPYDSGCHNEETETEDCVQSHLLPLGCFEAPEHHHW